MCVAQTLASCEFVRGSPTRQLRKSVSAKEQRFGTKHLNKSCVRLVMTPEMQFECLLVCRDASAHSVLRRVLRDFSISVEHCLSFSTAQVALAGGGHDIVVVDCEGKASSEFVAQIMHKRKKPTVVAILADGDPPPAAHFTVRQPLTIDSASSCLKSAHSRMLLEYRLHARHALLAHVTATDESNRPFPISVTDIGESGIGIKTGKRLDVGKVFSLTLPLPELERPLYMQVRVVWTRSYGTAGCELVSMPPVDSGVLRSWLQNKIRVKKPLISPGRS